MNKTTTQKRTRIWMIFRAFRFIQSEQTLIAYGIALVAITVFRIYTRN